MPPPAPEASGPASFVASNLRDDRDTMQGIFEKYRLMREECGESTERLRLENLTRILSDKVEQMKKEKNVDRVEVHLRKSKNKTRIVVRPHRGDST